MVGRVEIAGRLIGPGQRCFVVAEAGVNHDGKLEQACRLVDVAVAARADAVKFQAFKAERLAASSAPKAGYQVETTGAEESQQAMLRRLELLEGAHCELRAYCRSRGILYMCTPFDEGSADFLAELGVAVFKIPSGEITNLPFLAHIATKARPMIVSTGMASLGEVDTAVSAIEAAGNRQVILLHCVSSYPARAEEINLRAMDTLANAFKLPVGYSDHTLGISVALAAVARGACVIEKHFTLDRALPGPDHRMSLEPDELKELIQEIRVVEAALGDGRKAPTARERETAAVARKSLVAARHISAGTRLTRDLIAVKRPGTGLAPALLDSVLGRVAARDIPPDSVLGWDMLR